MNPFLWAHEGYERDRLQDGDTLVAGGSLTECLALLEDGDELVIVAHGIEVEDGNKGVGFLRGGMPYFGFK